MTVLIAFALVAVGVWGTVVALTDDPVRQAVTLSVFGLLLTLLFVLLVAPDVALSQLAVGSAVVPLMVLLAARKIRQDQRPARAAGEDRRGDRQGERGRS